MGLPALTFTLAIAQVLLSPPSRFIDHNTFQIKVHTRPSEQSTPATIYQAQPDDIQIAELSLQESKEMEQIAHSPIP